MGDNNTQGPFQYGTVTSRQLDLEILLALIPVLVLHIWSNGTIAFITVILCYGVTIVLESLSRAMSARKLSLEWRDASLPVFIGLTLLVAPEDTPLWIYVTGISLASLIIRQCFGGPGRYPLNPVAVAVLMIVVIGGYDSSISVSNSTSEQLLLLQSGFAQTLAEGDHDAIKELRGILLLLPALVLVARGTLPWRIPLAAITTFSLCVFFANYSLAALTPYWLHGELLLLVFFLAPENSTAPWGRRSSLLYGSLLAVMFYFLSTNFPAPLAIAAALLGANLWAPLLQRICYKWRIETGARGDDPARGIT